MENVWTVFTRNNHGPLWPGVPGFLCWCILMLCAAFGQTPELLMFAFLWTVALVTRRIQARALRKKGVVQYSTYTGTPYLIMKLCPRLTEIQAKNVEPLVCMLLSYMVIEVFEALGMIGALSMAFVRVVDAHYNFREAVLMRDGEIEAQHARWRREGWDEY
jgi:hypothetical protein